ncbi:protein of unknown function [Rhodovastum atsumiense]|nr:protein of unknown function [Rhodovastum atsumiense]
MALQFTAIQQKKFNGETKAFF